MEALLTHPNGSVEFAALPFSGQTFDTLGSVIKVDGVEFTAPIPVDDGVDGEDGTDGRRGRLATTVKKALMT